MLSEITFKSDMDVELIDSMGSDEDVARAARMSTGKDQLDQGKIEGLIGYLMRNGHTSCFEHCTVKVRVHAPVFVHRQIMTHRTLSKNSESGRYKELEPVFYVPAPERPLVNAGSGAHPDLVHEDRTVTGSGLPDEGVSLSQFSQYVHEQISKTTWGAYEHLIENDVATEVSRNVLPVSIYTSVYLTGNLLGWFNFLRLRNGSKGHPQYEVTEVAQKVEAIIADLYPLSYKAWKATL